MLFAEAIESVKCLDEGVIESVADANIGSILGIGFPGWTGGVLQYINGYEGGAGPASSPAPGSSPSATASASSRRRRWSSGPSAASRTSTRSRSRPEVRTLVRGSSRRVLPRPGQAGHRRAARRPPAGRDPRGPRRRPARRGRGRRRIGDASSPSAAPPRCSPPSRAAPGRGWSSTRNREEGRSRDHPGVLSQVAGTFAPRPGSAGRRHCRSGGRRRAARRVALGADRLSHDRTAARGRAATARPAAGAERRPVQQPPFAQRSASARGFVKRSVWKPSAAAVAMLRSESSINSVRSALQAEAVDAAGGTAPGRA